MTTVLVPLDGSRASERAVPCARSIARCVDADIVLARSSWNASDSEARQYLDAALDRFHLDIETTKRVVFRFPPEALSDLSAEYPDPLICMASSGRRGVAHAVLGSTSEEVIARSSAPIVACGPKAEGLELEHPRIGLCVDAGTHETAEVQFCVDWAQELGASVRVLTVRAEDDRPLSRFHPATQDQLIGAVALLEANGVAAEVEELRELQPARRLASYARSEHLALLVAAKRSGATGVGRDLLGSTVMGLIRQAPCPVLLPPAQ